MKSLVAITLALFQVNFLVAQTPTAAEYHSTSISGDGTTLYGYSSLEGSMNGSFPHGVVKHTYTTGFTLVAPEGSGIAPATCSDSQGGDPNSNFDPSCSADISLIGNGIYAMHLAESAICSYAGTFFSNSGSSVYVYPPSFINKLWGGLLRYGSIDSATGNLQNVQLTPEAYEYL